MGKRGGEVASLNKTVTKPKKTRRKKGEIKGFLVKNTSTEYI